MGALLGGAFGRVASLVLHDPAIDPGAFALVGMGAFYGGIAHVRIGSLIIVSELAGSYDLLVPLMLAEGIALVALRGRSLYGAQLQSRRDAPARPGPDVLGALRVGALAVERSFVAFRMDTRASEIVRATAAAPSQGLFPVSDADGRLRGVIKAETLLGLSEDGGIEDWIVAADLVESPPSVGLDTDLRAASELMLARAVRELPVVGPDGAVIGLLAEADIFRAFLDATGQQAPVAPAAAPE
jgi:CIC family chloride channel protein